MSTEHTEQQKPAVSPAPSPAPATSKDEAGTAFARDDSAPNTDATTDRQWRKKDVIKEGFRNKTRGEAWFNTISYVGVGYGLVTGTSVFLTWLLNDTHKFSEKFGKFATHVTAKFGWPRSIASIGTLFLGGTIASVLPVKWLEDKKPQIVKKLDRMLYSDEELKQPDIVEAHKELDELPKQTWLSVFSSRVVAFAATFAIFFLMGSNKSPLARYTGESIDKRSIQFGRWMDRTLHKSNPEVTAQIDRAVATNLEKMNPSHGADALKGLEVVRGKEGDRVASRVWSYIGLDAFYTLFTSASLYIFTRVFGGLIGKAPSEQPPKAHLPTTHADEADKVSTALPEQSAQTAEKPAITPVAPPVTKVTAPGQTQGLVATNDHRVTQTA